MCSQLRPSCFFCLNLLTTFNQVNWDGVAAKAGYKDAKNARAMWSRLYRSKILAATTAAGAGQGNNDSGEGPVASPTTKKRKGTTATDTEESRMFPYLMLVLMAASPTATLFFMDANPIHSSQEGSQACC